jgi:hypothetical protein
MLTVDECFSGQDNKQYGEEYLGRYLQDGLVHHVHPNGVNTILFANCNINVFVKT